MVLHVCVFPISYIQVHSFFQCLCLAPTYELALQTGDVAKKMAKHLEGVSITYAVRGEKGNASNGIMRVNLVSN